jgi:hypothetical protein
MRAKTIKFKIPVPEGSNVFAENGDKASDLLLYEVDQLEILEEVVLKGRKVDFHVRDGQYVKKGDVIFTEGMFGHKAMVADFGGIIEINADRCRILGQKRHIERRVTLNGEVIRVLPKKFIELRCYIESITPFFYTNYKVALTPLMYFASKDQVVAEKFSLDTLSSTFFINDTVYVDDLAKISAFGARRVVVNSVYVNNITNFRKEIQKFDSFAILSGFGEFVARCVVFDNPKDDVIWSKNQLYLSGASTPEQTRIYEHPFWGIAGKVKNRHELIGELDYNEELMEFYLKNEA